MSKGMEKLLRRMISPNADLRCTASEAMQDPYWKTREEDPQHRKFQPPLFANRLTSFRTIFKSYLVPCL